MPRYGRADRVSSQFEQQWPYMADPKRQMPAWLMGMIIAAVLFVIGVLIFQALGFGDNPVLESGALTPGSLSVIGL